MKARLLFMLSIMLMAANVVAEDTEMISVKFSDFPKGSSYAENEKHDLGSGLVIYTTLCHFTEQLRIYSSDTYNGYVVSDPLPGVITSLSFTMGYKEDVLNVYGSTDKENWNLIKGVETTSTSYKSYTLTFPTEKEYTCFKLDVKGNQQIRIESMSVTYIKGNGNEGDEGGSGEDAGEEGGEDEGKEEVITISAPIFNPVSTSFSTESLDVTIEVAEGYEVYYTRDGSVPSYTNAEEYNGTIGNAVTIYATDDKVTLQAIAVDPVTGKCSNVSSATYTYVEIKNNGSKSRPYTVAEVKSMTKGQEGKWVKGTIYGTHGTNAGEINVSNFTHENIVIGDATTYVPVQLLKGDIRDEVNLKSHPYLQGKEILIKGTLETYYSVMGVKNTTDYEITYDVPFNSYGYATLFLDMPVSVPDGTAAYYCTIENNYAKLIPVGSIIPSHTGVIMESTPNTICTLVYTTKANSNSETILAENQLVGFLQDSIVEANGFAYYALNVKDNRLGFYIPQTAIDNTDAAAGFTAKANKAYLQVSAEQKVNMFVVLREGGENAIVPVTHTSDDVLFDLQGRVVCSPTSGLYIRNGKKIIIQ